MGTPISQACTKGICNVNMMYILQCTSTWGNELYRFCCKLATMILLPGELDATLCEKAQGMVESPQLYFEVPEHILELI